jgi:hypothetical protein
MHVTCESYKKTFRLSEENMMEVYLDDLGTIQTVSDTLPNYLSWVHNILQDSIMNSSQSPGARALNSRTLLWRPHNPSCGNNYYILATEFLLKLPDKPDVDLPEGLAQAVWDVDHNSLPVPGNVHLDSIVDVEVLEVALELLVAVLQVKESLSDGVLELGRLEALLLLDLLPRGVHLAFPSPPDPDVRRFEQHDADQQKAQEGR